MISIYEQTRNKINANFSMVLQMMIIIKMIAIQSICGSCKVDKINPFGAKYLHIWIS